MPDGPPADSGLKLLRQLVDRTKNDYSHHAWGNGAVYMEQWGVAALVAGQDDVAEEAYLEALAHDPGSGRARHWACERLLCEIHSRAEEASRFRRPGQAVTGPGLTLPLWRPSGSLCALLRNTASRTQGNGGHCEKRAGGCKLPD